MPLNCCPLLFAFISSTVSSLGTEFCCKHSFSCYKILSFIEMRIVSRYHCRPCGPKDFQLGNFPNRLSINSAVNSMSACLSISVNARCSSDGHSALPLSVSCTSSPDAIPEFASLFSSGSDGIISLPSLSCERKKR